MGSSSKNTNDVTALNVSMREMHSRVGRSRAEQSRAEQSRAEQGPYRELLKLYVHSGPLLSSSPLLHDLIDSRPKVKLCRPLGKVTLSILWMKSIPKVKLYNVDSTYISFAL